MGWLTGRRPGRGARGGLVRRRGVAPGDRARLQLSRSAFISRRISSAAARSSLASAASPRAVSSSWRSCPIIRGVSGEGAEGELLVARARGRRRARSRRSRSRRGRGRGSQRRSGRGRWVVLEGGQEDGRRRVRLGDGRQPRDREERVVRAGSRVGSNEEFPRRRLLVVKPRPGPRLEPQRPVPRVKGPSLEPARVDAIHENGARRANEGAVRRLRGPSPEPGRALVLSFLVKKTSAWPAARLSQSRRRRHTFSTRCSMFRTLFSSSHASPSRTATTRTPCNAS